MQGDSSILEFLVAHERALMRFAELESKGQNGSSLLDVQRLLMDFKAKPDFGA